MPYANLAVGTEAVITNPRGLGEGFGAIPAKTKVTVTDVVDRGTPGLGDDDEVRLEFDEPGLVLNEEGFPEQGTIRRAVSVNVEQYYSLVEEAGE